MSPEPDLEKYVQLAKELGAAEAVLLSAKEIPFDDRQAWKCRFSCPFYGTNLMCPPYGPSPDEARRLFSMYEKAILFIIHRDRDDYDVDECNKAVLDIGLGLESKLEEDGYRLSVSFQPGPCKICNPCPLRYPCKGQERMRPALPGMGVDVIKTAEEHGIHVDFSSKTLKMLGLVLIG